MALPFELHQKLQSYQAERQERLPLQLGFLEAVKRMVAEHPDKFRVYPVSSGMVARTALRTTEEQFGLGILMRAGRKSGGQWNEISITLMGTAGNGYDLELFPVKPELESGGVTLRDDSDFENVRRYFEGPPVRVPDLDGLFEVSDDRAQTTMSPDDALSVLHGVDGVELPPEEIGLATITLDKILGHQGQPTPGLIGLLPEGRFRNAEPQ